MPRRKKLDPTRSARIEIRCREHELAEWQRAADAAGMPLSEWIRRALESAAVVARRRR